MVQDTGKASGAGAIKPVDGPVAIGVEVAGEGAPARIESGRWLRVVAVQDRWRIDDEWWRARPVSRMYYACVLEDGRQMTVFQDLMTGGWHRQSA